MLTLIFIICTAICITSIYANAKTKKKSDWNENNSIAIVICIISGVIGLFIGIAILIEMSTVIDSRYIDEKIAMYEEENERIETQIDELVKNYMAHEDQIFENAGSESSMTLVTLYPELKSDALVERQINTYTENNRNIKILKEYKIEAASAKWWLYFGH